MQTSVLQHTGATSSAPIEPERLTLGTLIGTYMAQYHGRDRTRVYQLAWWDSLLGDRLFLELTDDDVFRGLEQLRAQPAKMYAGNDCNGAPIYRAKGTRSAGTVNRYHAALSAVFTWAIKKRRAPRTWDNPCGKVEREPEAPGKVRFLSAAELERLLQACRESPWPRLYLLVLMAITTGARRGELLALTWSTVDLERAIAHVATTKNDHPKTLTLTPPVLAELRRFKSERPEALVFPSRLRITEPRHFESSWLKALREAKIKNFNFHALRHTCASYLAQNGASLLEIADVLGHRQLRMVKRYAHLTTETKAKLVNRVLGEIK
jgi:integrase